MSTQLSRFLKPATAAAAVLALAAGTALLTQSSENMLRSSFARALDPVPVQSTEQATVGSPLAASEEYWLTAMHRDAATPVSKGVSLGDRITFTLDGKERQYRVTSVSDFTPDTTEIDTRARAVRLVLVTARDTNDITARTVRFVMEIEGVPVAVGPGSPARTL